MKTLYFTVFAILLLILILFVINIRCTIIISVNKVHIYLFRIKIYSLCEEKLSDKIIDSEMKMMEQKKSKSSLYLHLFKYIHLNRIIIEQGIKQRFDFLAVLYGIKEIIQSLDYKNLIKINLSSKFDNTKIRINLKFYLGIVLINYLLLRRQIHESKEY